MKWMSNSADHRGGKNLDLIIVDIGQSRYEALKHWQKWVKDKVIGPPQATEDCSKEQLEEWGLIGIYEKEKEND